MFTYPRHRSNCHQYNWGTRLHYKVYHHACPYTTLDGFSKYILGRKHSPNIHTRMLQGLTSNDNIKLDTSDLVNMFRKFLAYLTGSTQVGMGCRASFSPINRDAITIFTIAFCAVE